MKLIYYADDDIDDLNIFKDAIESTEYQVVVFFSGKALLESLEESERKPDIIFLDIHMPLQYGDEILVQIRSKSEFDNIPVVLVTGSLVSNQIDKYLQDGANYLMQKEASLLKFREILNTILRIDWRNFKWDSDLQ